MNFEKKQQLNKIWPEYFSAPLQEKKSLTFPIIGRQNGNGKGNYNNKHVFRNLEAQLCNLSHGHFTFLFLAALLGLGLSTHNVGLQQNEENIFVDYRVINFIEESQTKFKAITFINPLGPGAKT